MTSGWQEKRYDVASITNTMGIGTKLDWQNDDEIELRLANKFQKVTFTTGQANDSSSSDLIVKVAIFADGKEIETVDVPFNDDDNRVYKAYKARIWSPSSDHVRR